VSVAGAPVVHLLCAGAAKGVVEALQAEFHAATGAAVDATFGAVGTVMERLDGGVPCDAIVLTATMIDALAAAGRVEPGTMAALGRVRTGVAVRDGTPVPAVGDADGLRATLVGARAVYIPDPERSTAGRHFVDVVRRLGIEDAVRARWRPYPNGATAMRALADAREAGLVGCTQVTEIRYTAGVALVGMLPPEFELATVYTAVVLRDARERALAGEFVQWLTGARSLALRSEGGFETA